MVFTNSLSSYYEKFLATGEVKCIDEEIPFEIPKGWEWCRFSAIYRLLTDGTHKTPKYTESGVPFISVKDMSSGKLSFSNTKCISEEEHKILSARCCPEYGDLLISKVGTTGIPLIIDTDKEFSIFVSLALIKFFPNYIDSKFLIHLINSPLIQEQVKRDTRGVGNKNWILTAISNTLLAIPPLVEQKRIVSKIEEIMPIADKYEKSQEILDRLNAEIFDKLKKSVLQEAIQGKLVPQIVNEGTARELLEQIKTEKEKLAQRNFFFWYKPENRQSIVSELRRMNRPDLIKALYPGGAGSPHTYGRRAQESAGANRGRRNRRDRPETEPKPDTKKYLKLKK